MINIPLSAFFFGWVWKCATTIVSLSLQLWCCSRFQWVKFIINFFTQYPIILIECFFFNVYSFLKDRERQSTSRGGAETEGDTESEAGSRLWAVNTEPERGARTHETMRSWPELKSDAQPTESPRCSRKPSLIKYCEECVMLWLVRLCSYFRFWSHKNLLHVSHIN